MRCEWMWRAYPFAPGEVCVAKAALGFVDALWETVVLGVGLGLGLGFGFGLGFRFGFGLGLGLGFGFGFG